MGSAFNYGTIIVNKNFDANDGLYACNVYFAALGNAIIMVRYYDV